MDLVDLALKNVGLKYHGLTNLCNDTTIVAVTAQRKLWTTRSFDTVVYVYSNVEISEAELQR